MKPKQPSPGKNPEPVDTDSHGATLDRYDIAILRELQADARLSNTELAARIGLSAAPTWRRVKWLEDQRYITGYRAELDRRKIGLGVLAFVRVDAERSAGAATKPLEDAIRQLPEVIACHYISGAGTFELQVMRAPRLTSSTNSAGKLTSVELPCLQTKAFFRSTYQLIG